MNRVETEERLEEAAELVSTHLDGEDQRWEIKNKKGNKLVLVFEVEYEEDDEDD